MTNELIKQIDMTVCTNLLFISAEDHEVLEHAVKIIREKLDCYYISDLIQDNFGYESNYAVEFISKAGFPEEEMYAITRDNLDHSMYIVVISYSVGSEYLGHHIYREGKWIDILSESKD